MQIKLILGIENNFQVLLVNMTQCLEENRRLITHRLLLNLKNFKLRLLVGYSILKQLFDHFIYRILHLEHFSM